MQCEKLFYNDSFATTFTAEVVDCFENKDHFAIVLDKTLFYPEGGGQPCDHGVIRFGDSVAEIFDVNPDLIGKDTSGLFRGGAPYNNKRPRQRSAAESRRSCSHR